LISKSGRNLRKTPQVPPANRKSRHFSGRNDHAQKDLSAEKMISSPRSKFFFQKVGAFVPTFWKKKTESHKKNATVTT